MRARVLLVEDDASVRRFVELALEDAAIELVVRDSVAGAIEALRAQPVHLVITDLMLPGDSGVVLLQRLRDEPALRAGARLVVFSAGIDADMRERLEALDVWRVLSKPASIAALLACIDDGAPAAASASQGGAPQDDAQARAIATHFGGNRELFVAWRASCLAQFALDAAAGDAACDAGDGPALRRLAHSLKTVLAALGHDEAAAQARALERLAEDGVSEAARAAWTPLAHALRRLSALRPH